MGRIAARHAIRTIQAQKERAEACQREEEDLLKPSISAISEDRADEIVEAYLDLYQDTGASEYVRAMALYQVGLVYMNQANPQRNDQQALFYLEKLLAEFPESTLCSRADIRIAELHDRGIGDKR